MFTETLHQILPGLFISDKLAASNPGLLKRSGITHIIVCAAEIKGKHNKEFTTLHLNLEDNKTCELEKIMNPCVNFIKKAKRLKGNTLLYDNDGKSRSVSIAIGYMIEVHGYKYYSALNHIKRFHSVAAPSKNFVDQLMAIEAKEKKLAAEEACNCAIF
ncbi:hypothetical protein SteCoe_17203 [Stentor coeruleus]|uniref:Tyrosine-protein phosphatase domain-containing protein n=1 Tax=Stentor coeruleus TaxID=5963 RepID=A0A1R2BZH9_9CILI|nr:hypothetical protein SteCoe_17203 [Stentor coeruleus]